MNRRRFIWHLRREGCVLVREGARHSIVRNVRTGALSSVPRHSEIDDLLCEKICKELGAGKVKK